MHKSIGRFATKLPYWPESVLGDKTCIYRSNKPDMGLPPYIVVAVDNSAMTVQVVTPEYREPTWLSYEAFAARLKPLKDAVSVVLMAPYDPKDQDCVKKFIKQLKWHLSDIKPKRYSRTRITYSKDSHFEWDYPSGCDAFHESNQYCCHVDIKDKKVWILPVIVVSKPYQYHPWLGVYKVGSKHYVFRDANAAVLAEWRYQLGRSQSAHLPKFSPWVEHAIRPQYLKTWCLTSFNPDEVLLKVDAVLHHTQMGLQPNYLNSQTCVECHAPDSTTFIQACRDNQYSGVMDCTIQYVRQSSTFEQYAPWQITHKNELGSITPVLGESYHLYLHINEYLEIYADYCDITIHHAVYSEPAAHPIAKRLSQLKYQIDNRIGNRSALKRNANMLLSMANRRFYLNMNDAELEPVDNHLLPFLDPRIDRLYPIGYRYHSKTRVNYNKQTYQPWLVSQLHANSRIWMWKLITTSLTFGARPCHTYIDELVLSVPKQNVAAYKEAITDYHVTVSPEYTGGVFLGGSRYALLDSKGVDTLKRIDPWRLKVLWQKNGKNREKTLVTEKQHFGKRYRLMANTYCIQFPTYEHRVAPKTPLDHWVHIRHSAFILRRMKHKLQR